MIPKFAEEQVGILGEAFGSATHFRSEVTDLNSKFQSLLLEN